MSRMGNWVLELQEMASVLSEDEFVKRYGEQYRYIWQQVNGGF